MDILAVTSGSLLWFVLGVALGTYSGVMIAPIATWWLARREWREASREVELGPKPRKRTIVPMAHEADVDESESRADLEPASV